jgi:hypothetical protein
MTSRSADREPPVTDGGGLRLRLLQIKRRDLAIEENQICGGVHCSAPPWTRELAIVTCAEQQRLERRTPETWATGTPCTMVYAYSTPAPYAPQRVSSRCP